jgi:L-methionine (R)-S-oxide reductase
MDFSQLETEIDSLYSAEGEPRGRLMELCRLLKSRVAHYHWFGFYIARREERLLDLGPFAGEATEHVLIPFGRGICGQAAESGSTFVVDDVGAASNYLACSLKVKSEIVVPVFASSTPGASAGGLATRAPELVGEIDIDSHEVSAFGAEDRAFLEGLAPRVAGDLAALRR